MAKPKKKKREEEERKKIITYTSTKTINEDFKKITSDT